MWLSKLLNSIFKKPRKSVKKTVHFQPVRTTGFYEPPIDAQLKKQMWAIGGGKGGVGKSLVTLMLGASLTRWGKKVILVDGDLGGSNLNLLTGINYPPCTLVDFIKGRINNIEEIALDTPVENLKVICGADDILGIANPKKTEQVHIFNHLKNLEADVILLDLGAGTSYATLDFFLYAPNRIIILSPQSTAMQNAYGFIKSSLLRKLTQDFCNDSECMKLINQCISSEEGERIDTVVKLKDAFSPLGEEKSSKLSASIEELQMGLVVNMVKEHKDINLGRSVINVANEYLTLNPEYLGFIQYDKRVDKSVNKMADFLKDGTEIITEIGFYDLASKIVRKLYKESKDLKTRRESAPESKSIKGEKQGSKGAKVISS